MTTLEDLCLAGHVVSSGATWCCNRPKGHDGLHDDGLGDRWRDEAAKLEATRSAPCDQCHGPGWVRIMGKVDGAVCGYETLTECQACNPDGRIPYTGLPELQVKQPHHLAHQTPPGVFDANCPACKEDQP